MSSIVRDIPSEILNAPFNDDHIRLICRCPFDWEGLLEWLGLRDSQVKEIQMTYSGSDQNYQALRKWKYIKGGEATYRAFISAAVTMGELSLAAKVADILRDRLTPRTSIAGKSENRIMYITFMQKSMIYTRGRLYASLMQ